MAIYITWLGHSAFRIESPEGKIFLIDPWIQGNPRCPESEKHQKKVDVLLCTHGHGDHVGDAVSICQELQPTVIGIYELASWLGSKGAKNIAPMNKGGTQEVAGVKVTMVHALHSSGIEAEDGSFIYAGEACGYVLEFSNGLKVYHAGDTTVFGDMKLIHELYRPDVAILPVGDNFTMGIREAEYACKLLRPRVVIPMHFGTFPVLRGNPQDLRSVARELNFDLWELTPGLRRKLTAKELVAK
ncbi:MAG: metal-dependent hydrolase [Acidobacteria bacterium]|nr:MAG: metal-dependent hydrolase [Acidobacteriota bacterium]